MASAGAAALEALMERYVDGDVRAFDRLYELLRAPVLSGLRRWLRTGALVEDAFQLTLLKLHASRAVYRRGAPVLPWVLTIARNVALDQLRSRAGKEQILDREAAEQIVDEAPPPGGWTERDEQEVIEAVHAAIDELPESMREVVRLHKLEGLGMAEIAAQLGIKEGAARVRAHRGYKALARRLLAFRSQRG